MSALYNTVQYASSKVKQTHQTPVGHNKHHVNARQEGITPHLETLRFFLLN